MDAHAPSKQSDQPPAPDAVLYFIYNKDGDGATSYEIENGSVATYWYGREFDLAGKHYFTGFAYNTPQKFGGSDEESYPDPDATVTLTQATFRLDRPGTQKPWRAIGAELWIGDFGGYEKADAIDASRETVGYETPGGQLLLAVPTTALQSGVSVYGYAVFRFNPGELADAEDRHWRYLGTVPAGEDNSAACDDGAVMTCASSSGMLRFVRPAQGEFPLVEVEMSGTTVGSQGEVRTLGAADKATFAYDEGKVAYVEQ